MKAFSFRTPKHQNKAIANELKSCSSPAKTSKQASIKRVHDKYNWSNHTKQLLGLAKIYGFWNYASADNREALLRYLEALFYLGFKPRAEQLLQQHMQQ
jgi:sucrose synthase